MVYINATDVERIGNTALRRVRRGPNGRESVALVSRPAAAAVLPVDEAAGRFGLCWQGRLGCGGVPLLEAFAGVVKLGDTAAITARAELDEEAGVTAEELELVAQGLVDPTFGDEHMSLFVARGLSHGAQRASDAYILPEWLALDRLAALAHVIDDLKTWTLLQVLMRRGRLPLDRRGSAGLPQAPEGRAMTIVADEPGAALGAVRMHRVRSRTAVTGQEWVNGVVHARDVVHVVVVRGNQVVGLCHQPVGAGGQTVTSLPRGEVAPGEGHQLVGQRIADELLGNRARFITMRAPLRVSPGYTTRRAAFVIAMDDRSAPLPPSAVLLDPLLPLPAWRQQGLDLPAQAGLLWAVRALG